MTNLNANLEITQAIDRLQTKYPEAWTNEVHRLEEIIPPSDPDYQILLKLRHKTYEVFDSEATIRRRFMGTYRRNEWCGIKTMEVCNEIFLA